MQHLAWAIFLFTFGACIGSFLNVVIYRVPRNESVIFPPSHCPRCGKGIRWYDNIPLFSWLALKGRCRFCHSPISPRYLVIEAVTGGLFVALYISYYVLWSRGQAETEAFRHSWPMYAAHVSLLCGLLACAMVDIECWLVPLEACWVVSLGGLLSAALKPHAFLGGMVIRRYPGLEKPEALYNAGVSAPAGAMALAALVGVGVAFVLLRYGYIRQSFIDASDRQLDQDPPEPQPVHSSKKKKKKKARVVVEKKDVVVSARKEILWELVFLAPATVLAVAAWLVVTKVPAAREAWGAWHKIGPIAQNLRCAEAAVFGYLVGGLWIWGMRILGTLAFGRLAMGMGDVHILAAVGAVTGWAVPSVVFFVAPIFGLAWAIRLWATKAQRELPYGPWLAAATLAVMLFHDPVVGFFSTYAEAIKHLW
ncbi:MAG: prepilin peptidase [Planctomycetota bacterium]|nr:prepilin peptidase [Planctomycetota bacterium]